MPELLLELLSEEIPARMQRRAIADCAGHGALDGVSGYELAETRRKGDPPA